MEECAVAATLTEFFANVYRPLRLRGRSSNTVRLYGNTIKQFANFLGREPTVDDLNDLEVSRYLEHRASTRSPYTSEKERNQLCSLWRCAADRRVVADRPCVPQAPLPIRVPQAWSIDELRRLLAVAAVAKGKIGDVQAHVFWPALILTLWQSAERIGAILAVTKEDYQRPRILVRAEYRKGGKRDRLYTFTDNACDLFDSLAKSRNGPHLFEWPKTRLYLWNRFGKLLDKAGLGGGSRCKFHQLRRSAATHYCARGGDPTALLDHSSPRITKAYLDPRYIDTGPKPCDVLPPID
jgi:integrase